MKFNGNKSALFEIWSHETIKRIIAKLGVANVDEEFEDNLAAALETQTRLAYVMGTMDWNDPAYYGESEQQHNDAEVPVLPISLTPNPLYLELKKQLTGRMYGVSGAEWADLNRKFRAKWLVGQRGKMGEVVDAPQLDPSLREWLSGEKDIEKDVIDEILDKEAAYQLRHKAKKP